ncbi:hypothetical protein MRX96_029915 [Rhipicephalus microplus]
MAMHEAPQELSRCEASSLSMRIMSLDMNNAGPHQHNSEQARMTHAVSRPHAVAPLSSKLTFATEKGAKLEDKKCRNRIAQARCRQRKIDRVTFSTRESAKAQVGDGGVEIHGEQCTLSGGISPDSTGRFTPGFAV